MKNYIFSLVCLCCTLLPALEGQAALHEHPEYPDLRKSDANIVGHILDKNTKEHLPYITVALKGTTIGTVTDATGHYFLKNLPEGNFVLEVSSVGYKTVRRNAINHCMINLFPIRRHLRPCCCHHPTESKIQ